MQEYLYALINFLLLVGIILLVGRKAIAKIFTSRHEKITNALDALESASKQIEPVIEGITEPEPNNIADLQVEKMESKLARTLAGIEKDTQNICENMRREMLYNLRNDLANQVLQEAEKFLTSPEHLQKIQDKQWMIMENILSKIKLTPGDIAYIQLKGVLYVTVLYAQPLDKKVVARIEEKTSELLATVGAKSSFLLKEDPSLLGGFQLRIGDTVYGCSVDDELYAIRSHLRKAFVGEDDNFQAIVQDVMQDVENIGFEVHIFQRGRVLSVSDGICWLDGLADMMYGEVVSLQNGQRGMVLDIKKDRIGCMIFGQYEHIDTGSVARRVGRMAAVPVGKELLGRIVDPLGNPIDGLGRVWTDETRPIEFAAPTIPDRSSVFRPLETGIKAIDALVPIGRGQRELIIGDRQTGKTALAIDTILNQKDKNTICIYVAIGQKESTIADIKKRLTEYDAMYYTTIVCASASSSAAYQYIAPFSGVAMAEYFMYQGKDVLIIYDDLSKHAVAYREISLLLHRPAGREAYPGDIFYLHARLLERAAQLSPEMGGGSMTALPIIETQSGDISAYIPTNVISITDGQIFLESDLFNQGQRPAINVGLSVSRVGGAAQTPLMKQTAASLRVKLAQYRELESFFQFGAEVDDATKKVLESGKRMMFALRQGRYATLPNWKEALILFAVQNGFTAQIALESMPAWEEQLFAYMESTCPQMCELLQEGKKLTDSEKQQLLDLLGNMLEVA